MDPMASSSFLPLGVDEGRRKATSGDIIKELYVSLGSWFMTPVAHDRRDCVSQTLQWPLLGRTVQPDAKARGSRGDRAS